MWNPMCKKIKLDFSKSKEQQAYELVDDFVTSMLNRFPKSSYELLKEIRDDNDNNDSYNLDMIINALETIKKKLGVK